MDSHTLFSINAIIAEVEGSSHGWSCFTCGSQRRDRARKFVINAGLIIRLIQDDLTPSDITTYKYLYDQYVLLRFMS